MKLFEFNSENYTIRIADEHVMLIKEFRDLLSVSFNKGEKNDEDGKKRLKAFKILGYIHLVYNWKSPYMEYSDKDRHETSLADLNIPEEWVRSPEVERAIEKYLSIQDTRLVKLQKSANRAIDELRDYFDTLDLQERDPVTGKPLFTAKDAIANIAALAKAVSSLKELDDMVKREKEQSKGLKGDVEEGIFD